MTMKRNDVLPGVDCDVVTCRYNDHNRKCSADSIFVGARNAKNKDETFCGTFTPKSTM